MRVADGTKIVTLSRLDKAEEIDEQSKLIEESMPESSAEATEKIVEKQPLDEEESF
jgi:hypothetical protein